MTPILDRVSLRKEYNRLAKESHAIAVEHGWWDERYTIFSKLMLVITEIAEAIEADRNDRFADVESFKHKGEDFDSYRNYIKGSVEEEFSDICIRLLDIAGKLNCDFTKMDIDYGFNRNKFKYSFADIAFDLTQIICDKELSYNTIINKSLSFMMLWAESLNIDIMYNIREKMKYNTMRLRKHGNKKY